MIVVYEKVSDMNAVTPEDGTECITAGTPYTYYTSSGKWVKKGATALTATKWSNPDGATGAGLYLSDTKTRSIPVPVFTKPNNTGVVVTNCDSLSILCEDPSGSLSGSWISFVDALGSTISPAVGAVQGAVSNGYLSVTAALLGNTGAGQYPYGGVNFDFIESTGIAMASKPTVNVSSFTGLAVTYLSDSPIKLQLKDALSDDGASWFVTLPISLTKTTTNLVWADFAQPGFGTVRAIPTSKLIGLQFQYDTQQTTANFTLYKIVMSGTGALYAKGITLANASYYTQQNAALITSWFDQFYEENVANTQGRIKWIDETHLDGSLTVSEGISYGMLLAAYMASSPSSIYYTRFKRMQAYWNACLSAHGLMNWQMVGFTGTVAGAGSASDADIHVAQALIWMYDKFGDDAFLADALSMLANIYNFDTFNATTSSGTKRLIGPGDAWNSYCNPSYIDLEAIRTFALYDTGHDWDTVYTDNLWLLQQNQTKNSAMYGLPSNWCDYDGNDIAGSSVKGHGYDACRVLFQLANAYRSYKDPEVLTYLDNIATNATLIANVTSGTPVSSSALVVSTAGVFGAHQDSLGLLSILSTMVVCSSITETQLNTALQAVIANTFDNTDYFYLAIKCFDMTSINRDMTREDYNGTAIESTFVLSFLPPDEGSSPYKMQVAFSTDGTINYRATTASAWGGEVWQSMSAANSSGGATGLQGVTGIQGYTGIRGVTGIQGNTGSQGNTGLRGVTGIQGNTGSQGNTGLRGTTGVQGVTGVGSTGSQGNTGLRGTTGVQGVTGPGAGAQGATGVQGVTGPGAGAQGVTGLRGATGVQGVTGLRGATGVQGVTGIQGNTGVQGTTGIIGPAGATGVAPSTTSWVQNIAGTNQVMTLEVVTVMPSVGSRVANRLYFLIG
jgi:endo-1,4-beta-D-glucanase Y